MLSGKIILLTGATDGIGLQTANDLAGLNPVLILHGKNADKGKKLKESLVAQTGNNNIYYFNADLSSFKDIENFAETVKNEFSRIDIIINNAGIYESKKIILDTGQEKTFMVNYLSAFVLTLQLLDLLKKSDSGKIINVSSMVHASTIDFENLNGEKFYSGDAAYSLSKLCNILFTYKLADLLKKDNISVNALHPGVINTKLLRAGWGPFGASASEGAARIMFLIRLNQKISGKYFENDKDTTSAAVSYDKSIQDKLWNYSVEKANQYLTKPIKI